MCDYFSTSWNYIVQYIVHHSSSSSQQLGGDNYIFHVVPLLRSNVVKIERFKNLHRHSTVTYYFQTVHKIGYPHGTSSSTTTSHAIWTSMSPLNGTSCVNISHKSCKNNTHKWFTLAHGNRKDTRKQSIP